jgi:hypothetical protein
MERMQALYTMHEILVAIDKPEIAKKIQADVDPKISKSPEDHVIKIPCVLDEKVMKTIENIVNKRNFKIEKIENTLVIH